ncbi:MAG: amidohydrolase [Bacteroidetes bacterium]|nr:amidohydrolase [Bacteroidota bacterium]
MLKPVELRHKLHSLPELMYQEFETTKTLVENISEIPGIVIHRPLETGLVVEYTVNNGDYLLFRADIDALPIVEETGLPFASTNNLMHACGHDVHTSILYRFLLEVVKKKGDRNILFLFQPAEEGGGGALKMLESGVFDQFNISKAFALHVTDDYDRGTIASTPGVLFASANEIVLEFHGRQAHVAFPENGIHAFDGLMAYLSRAKKLIEPKKDTMLFGYGKIQSGTARNIIPAHAVAECTIRALNIDDSWWFIDQLKTLSKEVEKETGVKTEVIHGDPYLEVVVDKALYHKYTPVLSKDFIVIDCGSKMTGEDFGFISKKYPSFMFWLGTSTGERHGLHTPKFFPPDETIEDGFKAFWRILEGE